MTLPQKKLIGVVAVFLVYSFALFLLLGWMISGAIFGSTVLVGLALVAGLFWPALAATAAAFVSGRSSARAAISIGSGLAVLAGGLFSVASLVAGVLTALLVAAGQRTIRREMETRVVFETRLIFRRGAQTILLALLIALLGLATPLVQDLVSSGGLALEEQYVATVLRPVAPILDNIFPGGYSPDRTVDDIIDAQIGEQLSELPPGVTVPPESKQRARRDLAESLGVPITGNETVPELAAGYVNQYIQELAEQSGVLVSLVMIVIALLALRALLPILVWPTLGFIVLILWVSRRVGLVYISRIQGTIERLYL